MENDEPLPLTLFSPSPFSLPSLSPYRLHCVRQAQQTAPTPMSSVVTAGKKNVPENKEKSENHLFYFYFSFSFINSICIFSSPPSSLSFI